MLWARSGDLAAATRRASRGAGGFAYLLIAGGVAELVLLGSFGGVWLAFLGWFLLQAAAGETRALAAREALGGLRVADVMARDPTTVRQGSSLGGFMDDVVRSRRFTTYPVVDNGHPVGLLRSGVSPRSRGANGTCARCATACSRSTRCPCSHPTSG